MYGFKAEGRLENSSENYFQEESFLCIQLTLINKPYFALLSQVLEHVQTISLNPRDVLGETFCWYS